MKNLFLDIVSFLKSLTFIDYVLYFSILVLLILVVSLIYLLKTTDIDEEELENTNNDDFDIKEAAQKISQEKPQNIDLTQYEKEQEEKAIISYEELVNSIKKNKINYETNEMLGNEISVKKIDLDNLISEEQEEKDIKVKVITYEHEEAFLETLKQLQKLLN